jgi:hypothetical protein
MIDEDAQGRLEKDIDRDQKNAVEKFNTMRKSFERIGIDWSPQGELAPEVDMLDPEHYYGRLYRILLRVDGTLLEYRHNSRDYTKGFRVFKGHCPHCEEEMWSVLADNFENLAWYITDDYHSPHTCPDIEAELDSHLAEMPLPPTWQDKMVEALSEAMSEIMQN